MYVQKEEEEQVEEEEEKEEEVRFILVLFVRCKSNACHF